MILGDFNLSVDELASTGWLAQIQGVALSTVGHTYRNPRGASRAIDFVVVDKRIAHCVVKIEALYGAPTSPHVPVAITMSFEDAHASGMALQRRNIVKNDPLPGPARPSRTADICAGMNAQLGVVEPSSAWKFLHKVIEADTIDRFDLHEAWLLYTYDAADDLTREVLGRRTY
mgnify:CR=1 FL=1